MKKNLVIGAITNYVWEDVEPFFKSYVAAGFENTDCVMFVHNVSRRTLNKIRACGVEVLQIPQEFINGKNRNAFVVNNYRWNLYADYLNKYNDKYNLIFTSDVRDAFFQRDIFKLCDSKNFLGIAIEDGYLTEKVNKYWITEGYGNEIYNEVKNERIICTGTVWGTCKEFQTFSENIAGEFEKFSDEFLKRRIIMDQGIGNIIIYYQKIFKNEILFTSDNLTGHVMTIGLTKLEDIKLNANGEIFNGAGELAAVVHQYDRKKLIVAMVNAKYCKPAGLFRKILNKCEKFLKKLFPLQNLPLKIMNKIKRKFSKEQ